ncbi:MAG: hypothetical protein GC204_17690 [Chloroflexi bacterium]|nr:hypothetical protein [Chloroflexota bacterium]
MLKVINTAGDQAVAQRISSDFQQAGYEVSSDALVHGDIAIFVLSQVALADQTVQATLVKALDLGLHIVPVLTQAVALPKLIDHLDVIDFSDGYAFDVLRQQVDVELSPNAPMPLRVLTPTIRRSNRSVGIILAVAVFVMFAVGLYAVGVLHIQAPIQEFNSVDTEVALTVDRIVAPVMATYELYYPHSTQDAENYPATLRAVPTVYRPFVEATATAIIATPVRPTHQADDFGF